MAFPTLPSHYDTKLDAIQCTSKMLNMALTMKSLSENCHLITPLSLSTDTFPLRGKYYFFLVTCMGNKLTFSTELF